MPSKIRGGTADLALANNRMPRVSALAGSVPTGDTYLLYDAFTTDRAAGAVNGTVSESPYSSGGGVLRTVVDANSKLSISGGVLTFATGGVGSGNPALWWAQQTRAAGMILHADLVIPNTGSRARFGWDTNQTGDLTELITFGLSGALGIASNGASVGTVGAYAAVAYQLKVILRTAGAFFFIKGDAFVYWTLIWASDLGTGNLFPALTGASTTTIFTADNVRIPTVPYIPPALAYDTFTRANGVLGSTETTDPDAQTIAAHAWTDQVGTWEVASNVAHASAVTGSIGIATYDAGYVDTMHTVNITRAAGVMGGVVRYADANNYIRFSHDGTNFVVEKVVAGTPTTVLTGAAAYSANAPGRVIIDGTAIRAFYNNVAVGSLGTISDAALQTSTLVGIYTTDTNAGNTANNVVTRARGNTINYYSALDADSGAALFTVGVSHLGLASIV